jgi:hypothetical protein
MRQLITRVEDQLLDDVKAKARAEGISVNTFVNRVLAEATRTMSRRREIARRIAEAGLTVHVTPSQPPPTHEELRERLRGIGPVAEDAIALAKSESWMFDGDGTFHPERYDGDGWPTPDPGE